MTRGTRYGDTTYSRCPICDSTDIHPLWRIPFHRASENGRYNGFTTQDFPSFGGTVVHEYADCARCGSIFLNPYSSRRKREYASRDNSGAASKLAAANDPAHESWNGYRARFEKAIGPYIPAGSSTIVDAACGGGQYLMLARQRFGNQFEKMVGLELSPLAVEHLRGLGFEGHQCDLDAADDRLPVDVESVDFVIFSEAFEHVEFPARALRRLFDLLRPGGRLFFSAQRIDTDLPVRPGENQCLSEDGLLHLLESLRCRSVLQQAPPGKWLCVIERP